MISEAKIRNALATLSHDGVVEEFSQRSTHADAVIFLQLFIRSGHLFFKYPNIKREKIRDEFVSKVMEYFRSHFDSNLQGRLEEAVSILKRAEIGYRGILSLLRKLPARDRSPEIQCWAAIELAQRRFGFIERRAMDSIKRSKKLIISDELEGTLDDGSKFSVDSATAGYIENLGATLGMLAHENGWTSKDGAILFPALVRCTEEEINESAAIEVLAMSWRRWERVEQRKRYWGGEFLDIAEGKANGNLPPGDRVYFEYVPTNEDQFDWIANERFKEYILQNFAELRFETFAHKKVSGISTHVKLLPEEFVSLNEMNSAALFSTILGIDVRDDFTSHSDLRIVEWLRGYCTLSEIAALNAQNADHATRKYIVSFGPGDLEDMLIRVGLSPEKADAFISKTTFSSRSEDLFDCPLLKSLDGSISLFCPAVLHADPGVVTYSNLNALGDTFEEKGKHFENAVLKFFREKGFSPYSIDTRREGDPYEIDVIVPWEQYLFVFECKNKGLSNNHPIQSYYFRKERDGFVKQLQRQIEALLKYPDMSVQAGEVDPREKIIVPSVLYELPYSETGSIDGVFITDWSSLSRFFKDKYLRTKIPYDLFEKDRVLHRTAIYSFWLGEKPTPNDLLRQLSDPVQIRIVRSRLTKVESLFVVDENGFGLTSEYHRRPQTLQELSQVLGFDARTVIKEEQRVRKMMASLNKRFQRKRLTTQTRGFRERQKRESH